MHRPPSRCMTSQSFLAMATYGRRATGPGAITATTGSMAPGSTRPTWALCGHPGGGVGAVGATSGMPATGAARSATTAASTTALAISGLVFMAATGTVDASGTTAPTVTLAQDSGAPSMTA